MNTYQKQRNNTDFILRLMLVNRLHGPSDDDLKKVACLIDKEELHLIENYKSRLRGSFHKQILHYLEDDHRIKEYLKDLSENNCRASLYNQLGVIEALRDFFNLSDVSVSEDEA